MSDLIAPEKLAEELLSYSEEVMMFQRGVRKQGQSKYLAVSRILPRRFKIVRMYKLAEKDNAVLVLFLDPTQRGYDVAI